MKLKPTLAAAIMLVALLFCCYGFKCKHFSSGNSKVRNGINDTALTINTKTIESNTIPDSIFQKTNLKHLTINGMDCDYRVTDSKGNDVTQCWMIRSIPPEISNLKELRELDLTLNAIDRLPPELGELTQLQVLVLSDNVSLTNIDVVTKLLKLKTLSLYSCHLKHLPAAMALLKQLKELGLTGNAIPKSEIVALRKQLPQCHILN